MAGAPVVASAPPPGAPAAALAPTPGLAGAAPPPPQLSAIKVALSSSLIWLRMVGLLLALQLRLVPRAWARLSSKRVVIRDEELLAELQEQTTNGRLKKELQVGNHTLPANSTILLSSHALASASAPLRLRFKAPPSTAVGGHGQELWNTARGILANVERPLLFWCWGHLIAEGMLGVFLHGGAKVFTRKQLHQIQAFGGNTGMVLNLTSFAMFLHLLAAWWRDQRSRGRRLDNDILGSQSSLREARINALTLTVQILIWIACVACVMWAIGVRIGQVLLFPSIGALVIGWVGREIVANIIAGFIIYLTQPFAQGDWVTLEGGSIDGWVQNIGAFHTRVVQWDKRPMYVPNFKIMTGNVQNNSRMTHRRILYELRLRIQDIPKISKIVEEMQAMVDDHEDVDKVQHRVVRWRQVGEDGPVIWLSCFTRPTSEGIRLGAFTLVQQSLLQRAAAIIFKYGADFASAADRRSLTAVPQFEQQQQQRSSTPGFLGGLLRSFSGEPEEQTPLKDDDMQQQELAFKERSAVADVASQINFREQVLLEREEGLNKRARALEAIAVAQAKKEREMAQAEERLKKEQQQRQQDTASSSSSSSSSPSSPGAAVGGPTTGAAPIGGEDAAVAAATAAVASAVLAGEHFVEEAFEPPKAKKSKKKETKVAKAEPTPEVDEAARRPDDAAAEAALGSMLVEGKGEGEGAPLDEDRLAAADAAEGAPSPLSPGEGEKEEEGQEEAAEGEDALVAAAAADGADEDALLGAAARRDRPSSAEAAAAAAAAALGAAASTGEGAEAERERGDEEKERGSSSGRRGSPELGSDDDGDDGLSASADAVGTEVHSGPEDHIEEAEKTRIPVKEMGD